MFTFVCPVCSGRTITVYGLNDEAHSAKCSDCGTYDALHKFQAAELTHNLGCGAQFDKEAIFPPGDIIAAMEKLHRYFTVERRAKQWAFGYVQSRDEPALIGIEHIRNMASAFRMELIAHPGSEMIYDKVREAAVLATSLPTPNEATPINFHARIIAQEIERWLFGTMPVVAVPDL